MERTFSTTPAVPLKPGRSGDIQPAVNSWSLLAPLPMVYTGKAVRKGSQTPAAILHRAALWRSVVDAAGFSGPFSTWWNHQSMQSPHMLPWFPMQLPLLAIAEHVRDVFHAALRAYEKDLISSRVFKAKQWSHAHHSH